MTSQNSSSSSRPGVEWIFPMPGLPSSAASFGVPIGAPTPRGRGPRNGRSGGHRSGGGAGARRDKDEDQDLEGAFSWPKQKGGMIKLKVATWDVLRLVGSWLGWWWDWLWFEFFFWGGCLACDFEVCLESCFCLAWFFFLWFFGDLLMFGQPCGIPGDFRRGSFWRWWPFTSNGHNLGFTVDGSEIRPSPPGMVLNPCK